jgi:hypothetical protein
MYILNTVELYMFVQVASAGIAIDGYHRRETGNSSHGYELELLAT